MCHLNNDLSSLLSCELFIHKHVRFDFVRGGEEYRFFYNNSRNNDKLSYFRGFGLWLMLGEVSRVILTSGKFWFVFHGYWPLAIESPSFVPILTCWMVMVARFPFIFGSVIRSISLINTGLCMISIDNRIFFSEHRQREPTVNLCTVPD